MGKPVLKNILFVRSDRFGEFLLSLFAVKLVKENFPESKVFLMGLKENLELIRGIDCVDEFVEFKEFSFSGFNGAFRLSRVLKQNKIDCCVLMNPRKEFHLGAFLAATPLRLGYDRKWGFCLNRKIPDLKHECKKHEREYNIDLVSSVCDKVYVPELSLPVDESLPEEISGRLEAGQDFVFLHPFSSDPRKEYPRIRCTALIKHLHGELKKAVVLIGSQEHSQEAQKISAFLKNEVINLCGMTSLRNLATLLKNRCGVLITTDSGPLHLAQILNKSVVALFGPTDSVRWGPYNENAIVLKKKFIESITVEEIHLKLKRGI